MHMPPIQNSELSPDGRRITYSQQAHDRWEVNTVYADGTLQNGVTSPDPIVYYLLDIAVPYQEHVLPMIPAGMTVRDLIKE